MMTKSSDSGFHEFSTLLLNKYGLTNSIDRVFESLLPGPSVREPTSCQIAAYTKT